MTLTIHGAQIVQTFHQPRNNEPYYAWCKTYRITDKEYIYPTTISDLNVIIK